MLGDGSQYNVSLLLCKLLPYGVTNFSFSFSFFHFNGTFDLVRSFSGFSITLTWDESFSPGLACDCFKPHHLNLLLVWSLLDQADDGLDTKSVHMIQIDMIKWSLNAQEHVPGIWFFFLSLNWYAIQLWVHNGNTFVLVQKKNPCTLAVKALRVTFSWNIRSVCTWNRIISANASESHVPLFLDCAFTCWLHL